MKPPTGKTPPAVVEQTLQLWIWLDAHLPDLPAYARASSGARLIETMLTLLDLLSRAAWMPRGAPECVALLREANQRVAFARLLLRGMLERRYFSTAQHAHAIERLDGIGRMVGAWLRATERRP